MEWTPELKRDYAEAFIMALDSLATNPRFPKAIYAILDENGQPVEFDIVADAHTSDLSDGEVVVDRVQSWDIGEWDRNEDGTLLDDGTLIDAMTESLEEWGTFQAIADSWEE